MTRIAVLGTSHVAAVKHGWDQLESQQPDLDVTFFALPAAQFSQLSLNRAHVFGLRRKDAESERILQERFGATQIDLKEFDFVWKVGHGFDHQVFASLAATCDVYGVREVGKPTMLTLDAFTGLMLRHVRKKLPGREWRNWKAPHLLLSPTPFPSETLFEEPLDFLAPWIEISKDVAGIRNLETVYREILREEMAAVGGTMILQPDSSIGPLGLTLKTFKRGARGYAGNKGNFPNDPIHMNDAFGKLMWQEVFDTIAAREKMKDPQNAAMV